MRKELGKISAAKFGTGGYQGVQFGVTFTFGSKGWGVSSFVGMWGTDMKVDACTKWTEADRSASHDATMRMVQERMREAKIEDFADFVGVPVECTFDGNILKEWRILTEVL